MIWTDLGHFQWVHFVSNLFLGRDIAQSNIFTMQITKKKLTNLKNIDFFRLVMCEPNVFGILLSSPYIRERKIFNDNKDANESHELDLKQMFME